MKLAKSQFLLLCGALTATSGALAAPESNALPDHARALHFARGATRLSLHDSLSGTQSRYYTLEVNAGQHLKISAHTDSNDISKGIVPLLKVTPPCGQYNGDKTANYAEDSSRAGTYKIEIAPNTMASNGTAGTFTLYVLAY